MLGGQTQLLELFNAARDDEYGELVDRCDDFCQQVRNEYEPEHFSFAELEENDVDLATLRDGWTRCAPVTPPGRTAWRLRSTTSPSASVQLMALGTACRGMFPHNSASCLGAFNCL